MKRFRSLLPVLAGLLMLAACADDTDHQPTDTLSSGTISISADETYRPVIEEQMKVFDSSFPKAKITVNYKPEAACFQDLFENRARLILVTRDLGADEKKTYLANKIVTTSLPLARDAVAVVVHPESVDSIFAPAQIRGILTGQYAARKFTVVFDNEGSSTVRYITDSLIAGGKLAGNVFAARGNDSVVSYVSQNPDAIGFVGLPYVAGNINPETGSFMVGKVRVASIRNDSTGEFLKPYQAYLALRTYPFTRELRFISREAYPGLGTGLANFLARDRGQLIFHQAGLFPLRFNVVIRDANINP